MLSDRGTLQHRPIVRLSLDRRGLCPGSPWPLCDPHPESPQEWYRSPRGPRNGLVTHGSDTHRRQGAGVTVCADVRTSLPCLGCVEDAKR